MVGSSSGSGGWSVGRGWRRTSASCLCGLLLAALTGCGNEAPKKADAPPPPSVEVVPVRTQDMTSERVFTGRIEAIDKVQIRARVQGFLKARRFDEGAEVQKGDLLYEIEREPFEVTLKQAAANLASAQAALTLAEQTYARAEELADRATASRASLDSARSGLVQAQATVRAREADHQTASLNLSYTRIHAPMHGRVGRSAFSVGNLVGPDSGALVTLVAQDPMYVTFPVPQWLLMQVAKAGGEPQSLAVKLRMVDGSIYDQQGKIEFLDVQATSSTDSVIVRASIPNPKRLLIDQQLVNVLVVSKEPEQRLVISQSALLLDQQGPYVLVVGDDNKVVVKRIVTGEQRGPVIVVQSGLAAGERTIVSGQQKTRPGIVVAPHTAAPAAPATPAKK